jgi:hypothetical protein
MGVLERKQKRERKGAGERGQLAAHREHGLEKFLEVELSIIFVRLKSVVKFNCRMVSIDGKVKERPSEAATARRSKGENKRLSVSSEKL